MANPKRPDPDEKIIPGRDHTPALPFAAVLGRIRAAVAAYMHLKGFTYSPKSDLVFDVERLGDIMALFVELVRGNKFFLVDQPVYLIAITNHKSIEVDDILQRGYDLIAGFSNQPLIGYWKDPKGVSYLDAVITMQFINRDGAIGVGKRYGQEYILAIWADGSHEHIKTN